MKSVFRIGSRLAVAVILAGAGAGLLRASPAACILFDGTSPFRRIVRCMERHEGRLWVGTYGSGILWCDLHDCTGATDAPAGFDGAYRRDESPLPDDRVNGLAYWRGRLWMATCNGICSLDTKGGWRYYLRNSGRRLSIYHCLEVIDDVLYAGTTGAGLLRYDEKRDRWVEVGGVPGDAWVNDLESAPGGAIWVACLRDVGLLTPASSGAETGSSYRSLNPPLDDYTALASYEGELWIGTAQKGLLVHDGRRFFRVRGEGVPRLWRIHDLAAWKGRLWIAAERSIVSFSPRAGWTSYDSRRMEDAHPRVLLATADGLFAGTSRGNLLRFDEHRGIWRVLAGIVESGGTHQRRNRGERREE